MNLSFNEFLEAVKGSKTKYVEPNFIFTFPGSSKLDTIQVYNYLELITKSFDPDMVKSILKSINTYLNKMNNSFGYKEFFGVDAFKLDQFVEIIFILEDKLENHRLDNEKGINDCKDYIETNNLIKSKKNSNKGTPQDILDKFDSYVFQDNDKNESDSSNFFLFEDDIKYGLKLIMKTNRLLSLEDSLQKLIKLIHHCALLKNLKVSYQIKCDEYQEFKKFTESERGSLDYWITNVDTEIKKLEHLQMLNLFKNESATHETTIFLTNLDDKERLIKCNEIINKKGSVTEQLYDGSGNKGTTIEKNVFKDITEKHRPTLMYILGGEYPNEVETIKVAVIANLSMLLKQITDVDGVGINTGKKVVPEFMKRFCIEYLKDKEGEIIKAIK